MKILLDHCIDWRVGRALSAHTVASAAGKGWQTLRNGKLLATAAKDGFDVLLTVDQNIKHEQNLAVLPIAVVVLVAKSNRRTDLMALIPAAERAMASLSGKVLVEVTGP